ncbi:MAG TPA: arginase family protein [Methylomirabilota bacterium]|jgi:agmatinase|nr:arginase family protein [Methylomirabilota bacterium]
MYTRDLLPSFAGVNTFARMPEGTFEALRAGMVAVAGVAHDGTSSSRQGVRQGPKGIREASVDFTYDLYASTSKAVIHVGTGRILRLPAGAQLVDVGDLPVYPMDLARTLDTCRRAAAAIVRRGAFPVVLGGDHFITVPLVQGVVEAIGKRVGLIQLSTQLDLGERDAVWGPDWHGATIRRLVEGGSVDPRNVAFVGTQGYVTYPEWEFARAQGMTVITADDARAAGARGTIERALAAAGAGCEAVYLSLDIDVVDSGYASGTGDVLVGGLTPAEVLALMRELSHAGHIAALDVVEVAPGLDQRGRSERLAAEAIVELIAPRVFGA